MHFTDSHLGRKQPSQISEERVESTLEAFRYCIQRAVEEDVDFIVHSGDVFDTVYPWHSVIERAKNILETLDEHEIPMYVIRGNHDRSFGRGRTLKGLAIDHLQSEYVNLIDPSPEEFPENAFIDHNDIRIYGLGYHGSRTPELMENFDPDHDGFNILLLHDFIEGVTRSFSDDLTEADELAVKNIDYVGIGHDHRPNTVKIRDTVFSAPGGTVDYSFNTTEFGKTYNIVEVADGRIDRMVKHDIPQQLELKRLKIDATDFDTEKVLNELDNRTALRIMLKAEGETDIDIQQLTETLEDHEKVASADITLELEIDGYNSESETEELDVEKILKHRMDEELGGQFHTAHKTAGELLADDTNLTSSGFNLKKEARKQLQNRVEEVMFESDSES